MFTNGTTKHHMADGRSVIRFANGDVKKSFPAGNSWLVKATIHLFSVT